MHWNPPPWYKKVEDELLKVRWLLWLALLVLVGVSVYFIIELARGKKAIPAALWVTYMFMP